MGKVCVLIVEREKIIETAPADRRRQGGQLVVLDPEIKEAAPHGIGQACQLIVLQFEYQVAVASLIYNCPGQACDKVVVESETPKGGNFSKRCGDRSKLIVVQIQQRRVRPPVIAMNGSHFTGYVAKRGRNS